MLKVASVMRIDLIKIAYAAMDRHDIGDGGLMAEIDRLQAAGPYTEASEDEIESFDAALEAFEEWVISYA